MTVYLHHSTLLSDTMVEAVEIKGLLANGRHGSDRRSLLLQKGQQLVQEWATVHLIAHVIQLGQIRRLLFQPIKQWVRCVKAERALSKFGVL